MIKATLCFLRKDDPLPCVLLGYKKTGFGQGKFAGFGGKIEIKETDEQAAIREVWEEARIKILPTNLHRMGHLVFTFPYKPEWDQIVYVFLTKEWYGKPMESREMKPEWFAFKDIPYAKMWDDNAYWLPYVLDGRYIEAQFHFMSDNAKVERMEIFRLDQVG